MDTRFQPLKLLSQNGNLSLGINLGGWGLRITTEDIAKLGQFYLQKGQWKGPTFISKLIEQATSKQVSSGSNPDDWAQGYGFQFWRSRYDSFRADGSFGQFCLVLPQHSLVIATTAGVYDMGQIMNIAWETLLPGLRDVALLRDSKNLQILKNKIEELNLPKISGDKASLEFPEKSMAYLLDENPQEINTIKLDLNGANHNIEIIYKDKKEIIKIGSERYLKNELRSQPPFTKGVEYLDGQALKVAVNGAWISSKQYLLRMYFYESTASVDYTFNLRGMIFLETTFNHTVGIFGDSISTITDKKQSNMNIHIIMIIRLVKLSILSLMFLKQYHSVAQMGPKWENLNYAGDDNLVIF